MPVTAGLPRRRAILLQVNDPESLPPRCIMADVAMIAYWLRHRHYDHCHTNDADVKPARMGAEHDSSFPPGSAP
jgi:hypothetical protein